MIVTKLIGGLGNQMFQYALGRKLALREQDELYLDRSFFDEKGSHTPRDYELDVFQIDALFASDQQLNLFKHKGFFSKPLFQSLLRNSNKYKVVVESGHQFQPAVLQHRGNLHLIGYWQSERYFLDVRETLLNDFQFRTPLRDLNLEIATRINALNAVSLHIRRGDYVTNAAANTFHGVCGIPYYNQAIALLNSKFNNLVYFVFSDDISWARENLKLENEVFFIDHNMGKSSFEDMRLMSMCNHHIIANSSFSWWGAWLNRSSEKCVVAPKIWFQDTRINTTDILPTGWIAL